MLIIYWVNNYNFKALYNNCRISFVSGNPYVHFNDNVYNFCIYFDDCIIIKSRK